MKSIGKIVELSINAEHQKQVTYQNLNTKTGKHET